MAGPECCVPAPPATHSSVGGEESWGGIDVYVNHPASSTAAVILVSDVFGWKAPLFRKLADKVAAAGFVAVAPDLLYGDFFDPDASGPVQTWIQGHKPHLKPLEDCKKLVSVLQSKGITSIGLSGFCWGAKVVILASKETTCNALVMCHPSMVTIDDIKACKAPLAILAAETDHVTPVDMVNEFKKHLEHGNQDHFVKVFPGTAHGWTVRYDVNSENAVKNAEEAHEDFIAWFRKHLL
ncbi:hypothetical protein SELMODRAFT_179981 [Selaginella moellendorffii]|uniref:Dienelactone hydrolase domain-containing protein n=1 Tax=Selaginella moellendorffii TaxID=88036 RepID=D8SIF5_SELML|nr:endo-1,3;1,4-beta-D-glucanase [Selaginella moellendorffii]EFJ15962.1 hypothetical protein SELMODRAFT_179981 [Selaginella moellendorffii]|eukprot:XP_024543773.1 endo-1,3;1,4-beta-D-glucanase [Selaginella moellendorffii]